MASSLPGLIFAIMVKPWHAGVCGYIGPYLPCFGVKNPSFGIAIALGFVQSRSLGVEGVAVAAVAMSVSLYRREILTTFKLLIPRAGLSSVNAALPEPVWQAVLLVDDHGYLHCQFLQ